MTTQPSYKHSLDEAIDLVLSEMAGYNAYDEDYAKMVDQLDKLYKIKLAFKEEPDRVSKDALLAVGANLIGIVLILGHEKAHVVTSKALSFVLKTRV